MKKLFYLSTFLLAGFSSLHTQAQCGVVTLDKSVNANGASSFNISTTNANELIMVSVNGWPGPFSGSITVDGNSATLINSAILNNSGEAVVYAYAAASAGSHAIVCNESGYAGNQYIYNFGASFYITGGVPLSLANINSSSTNDATSSIDGSLIISSTNSMIYCSAIINDACSPDPIVWTGATVLNELQAGCGLESSDAYISAPTVGTYSLSATNSGQSVNSDPTEIVMVGIQPLAVITTVNSNIVGCIENTGSVSATAEGTTPYTYSWSGGQTISTITGLSAGSYTITVNDACNNTATATVSITQVPSTLTATANSLPSECAGTGIATGVAGNGTGPYTYSWNTGRTWATATGLSVGSYTVTVWDANSCSATASVSITQAPVISVSTTALKGATCPGTGSATAKVTNGVSAFQYSWNPGGSTRQQPVNLNAEAYTVTVTDHLGCTATASVSISQAPAVTLTATVNRNETCEGTGTATAAGHNGQTPYQYSWSLPGGTNAQATGLNAGTYTVNLTDALGCTASATVVISQAPAVTVTAVVNRNETCEGTGEATATGHNGVTPYTFIWSPNGGSNAQGTGLNAGTMYTITATDHLGCTASATVSVSQATALTASINSSCSNNLTNANIIAKGGTAPYTYSWASGGTSSSMKGLSNGSYTVTVKDKLGCSVIVSKTFSCSDAPDRNDGNRNDGFNCCEGLDNVSLYPNPNSGQFTLSGLEKGMMIEMYDYTGRRISNITAGDNSMPLNIANQPNGIYLVRILNTDGTLVSEKKVVKTN